MNFRTSTRGWCHSTTSRHEQGLPARYHHHFKSGSSPRGQASRKLSENANAYCCTSIVVACELRFGAKKAGAVSLRERIDQVLARLDVLPLDLPADSHFGRLRAILERRGTPIGPNDLLIAAQALAQDLTLVTDNTSEFGRVDGLRIENWLRP
jgi:tRNA(fMet)-specific endonuclease VapC